MPKKSKYPGLRKHIRKGKAGQVWVSYYLDRRAENLPDLPLGTNLDAAIAKWRELRSGVSPDRGLVREALKRWIAEELPKYEVAKTRADYGRQAAKMLAWCGDMRWEHVTLPMLVEYLRKRKAKTQANRELAVLSIVWGRARLWGMTKLPWPADGVKNWKNVEGARRSQFDMDVFDAIYQHADQTLCDAMDLASATGLRITDVLTVELPDDHHIEVQAIKTGKQGWFDARKSPVLTELLQRRRAINASTVCLVCTSTGRAVSETALRARWGQAKKLAIHGARATGNGDLADRIEAAWLRDHRKLAANLAPDTDGAAKLLQHSSTAVTRKHYRTAGEELEPTR